MMVPETHGRLEAESTSEHLGGLQAVAGIDLTVGERAILSVIGGNGAGKTTFINTISGVYHYKRRKRWRS